MNQYSYEWKHKVNDYEVDPYQIVHHSYYLIWMEQSQKQCLKEYLSEYSDRCDLQVSHGTTKRFHCKYLTSALNEMDIIVKTFLISQEEQEDGVLFQFKHFVVNGETKQTLVRSETEMFVDFEVAYERKKKSIDRG